MVTIAALVTYITSPPLSIQSTAPWQTCTQKGHFCFSGLSLSRCLQCSPLKNIHNHSFKMPELLTFYFKEYKLKKVTKNKHAAAIDHSWMVISGSRGSPSGESTEKYIRTRCLIIYLQSARIILNYPQKMFAPTPWTVLHIKAEQVIQHVLSVGRHITVMCCTQWTKSKQQKYMSLSNSTHPLSPPNTYMASLYATTVCLLRLHEATLSSEWIKDRNCQCSVKLLLLIC